jgi:hypothetical protein
MWEPARFLGMCPALSVALAEVAEALLPAAARREPVQEWRRGGFRLLGRILPGPSLDADPGLWREWRMQRPTCWGMILCVLYAVLAIACAGSIARLTTLGTNGR